MRYIGCGEEHFARQVEAVVKYSAHEVNETDTSLKIAESARDILQMAPKPRVATLPSFIDEALVSIVELSVCARVPSTLDRHTSRHLNSAE
jgi:hypothetical protein